MKTTIADSIVPLKLKDLVEMVMTRNNMDFESALYYVYFSKLYSDLNDDRQKLWYESSEALYSLLVMEKMDRLRFQSVENKVLLFFVFCIQNYIRLKMPGQEEKVLDIFSRGRVYSFLADSYEMLHSQDVSYIMDTIEIYLKKRGY